MMQCREWAPTLSLLAAVPIRVSPELERYAGNVPVIEVANVIRDASVGNSRRSAVVSDGLSADVSPRSGAKERLNVLLFLAVEAGGSQRWWRVFVRH